MPKKVVIGRKLWEISDTEKTTIRMVDINESRRVQTITQYAFYPEHKDAIVEVYEVDLQKGLSTREEVLKHRFLRPVKEFLPERPTAPKSWWNHPIEPSPEKESKQPEDTMSENLHGVRGQVPDPSRAGRLLRGTVFYLPENPNPERDLFLLLDQPDDRFAYGGNQVGAGYGALVRRKGFRYCDYNRTDGTQSYAFAAPHLGVVTTSDFMQDGVRFPRGAVGRVVRRNFEVDVNRTHSWDVSWLSVRNSNFRSMEEGGQRFDNCWSITRGQPLAWCTLHSNKFCPIYMFLTPKAVAQECKFKRGDYVVYCADKPQRVSQKNVVYVVAKGTVLRVLDTDREGCCLITDLAGGCVPEALGADLTLKKGMVRVLDVPYFGRREQVEVADEITFKKHQLQGKTARVLLPTDQDGDVGIEFPEDIGAGSLDGAGAEGKCLYVPASALKKQPE